MKISPIAFNLALQNSENCKPKENKQPTFTSIFADAKPETERAYAIYTLTHPNFSTLKASSTRIFRELPSELAISKLLDPNKKTQIKVLGVSDGSEAFAYGITLKEAMGDKAKENFKITGVDIKEPLIELAKTGRIVCSDIERYYANNFEKDMGISPVSGANWGKYLKKSQRPDNFCKLVQKYPFLVYMENDPVVGKNIGHGLEWYEVNQEGLPEITFEAGDMRDYLNSTDDVEQEVYVIANSAAYIAVSNPDEYINIFQKIADENKGRNKDVYVVTGSVESKLTNPRYAISMGIQRSVQEKIKRKIANFGFENVSEFKLRKKGIVPYKETAACIYKLNNK